HIKTGALIVYTSQDSVFQIAAHEDIVSVEELYRYCRIAREILQGENAVLRVIARPFIGEYPFIRTSNRHDFSLTPPSKTMLDIIYESKLDSIAIGKIIDIFTERGMNKKIRIVSNFDGMEKTINEAKTNDFTGLCFVNLVDFDSKYGHRRDIDGYAQAVTEFDVQLGILQESINEDDLIIITADHGCDPAYKLSTDHTREYVPVLCYSKNMNKEIDLGLRKSFADISSTILENFGLQQLEGKSFLKQLI
ncbi:MAG: phosphopentomutase, partial [Clostridia bacterium]|nr:phosphopentomutase [Clostridia bacterium]